MPRFTSARRRSLVFVAAAAASVVMSLPGGAAGATQSSLPPGALILGTADASFGGWQKVVLRRNGDVRVPRSMRDTVRLSDGGRPAGYVMLGVTFAPRSSVVSRAEVNIARQVLAPGRARPVLEVGSAQGRSLEAGLLRGADGRLRWAVWAKRANGARHALAVSPVVVPLREWVKVTFVTQWNRAGGLATLRVNGRPVVRTPRVDLSGVGATRVHVGLGRPGSRREVGVMYVRRTMTWGTQIPGPATPPHGHGTEAGPAAGTPGAGSPGAGSPGAGTPAPGTPAPRPSAPTGPATPPPPGTIPGTVFKTVDFDSGSYRSQHGTVPYLGGISSYQAVSTDRIQSVLSPDGTNRVGRFEVRNGDVPVSCCGERSEVSIDTNDSEGQERWYTWATMFDPNFVFGHRSADFQVVTQFHSRHNGQPPVAFYVEGGNLRLAVNPKNGDGSSAGPHRTIWSTPITKGRWYRFALHVKWSGSDSVGFLELFVDGQPAGAKTYTRTLYPGYQNYTKLGYYRDGDMSDTSVVYHDDFRASNAP